MGNSKIPGDLRLYLCPLIMATTWLLSRYYSKKNSSLSIEPHHPRPKQPAFGIKLKPPIELTNILDFLAKYPLACEVAPGLSWTAQADAESSGPSAPPNKGPLPPRFSHQSK